jgi:LysM repeat protein
MYGIYQVANLDTLDSIAKEVGTSKEELKKLNGIIGDMNLRPGSFLIVPKYDNSYEKYVVKKGDNMYAIAKKYGVDYPSLLKLNGLDDGDFIYPEETILIPRGMKAYVTEEESMESISKKVGVPLEQLLMNNPNLVVLENQVVRY